MKTPLFGVSSPTVRPVAKMCIALVGSMSMVLTTAAGNGEPIAFHVLPLSVDSCSWFTGPVGWNVVATRSKEREPVVATVKSKNDTLGLAGLVRTCVQSHP